MNKYILIVFCILIFNIVGVRANGEIVLSYNVIDKENKQVTGVFLDLKDYQNLVEEGTKIDLPSITKHVEKYLSKNGFRYDNLRRLKVDHWKLQKITIKPINPQRLRSVPFERITKKTETYFLAFHYLALDRKGSSLANFIVFTLPNKKVLPVVKKTILPSEFNKRSDGLYDLREGAIRISP